MPPPGNIDEEQIVLEDIELMQTDDAAGTQQVTIQVGNAKSGKSEGYDDLLKITLAQKADGSFEATQDFRKAICYGYEKLAKARRALPIDAGYTQKTPAG